MQRYTILRVLKKAGGAGHYLVRYDEGLQEVRLTPQKKLVMHI